jgi:fucose permease
LAFKKILLISNFESSLVQAAFYGGYCFMAIPAALFIKKFSYKTGILVGLALYAAAALFFPVAGMMMSFPAFLAAYFVMTCGLSFLETTSNPYILSMGDERTATQRLNLAQAFNPMGSLTGMVVAMTLILANLHGVNKEAEYAPLLATAAQERIEAVAQASEPSAITLENQEIDVGALSLDELKWTKIQELGVDSWVGGEAQEQISGAADGAAVDWPAIVSDVSATHEVLAQRLAIIDATDAVDAAVWQQLNDQGLTTDLDEAARAVIEQALADGAAVNWKSSPLLDGSPDETQARTLLREVYKGESAESSLWTKVQQDDLDVLQGPYFIIGLVVLAALIIFIFTRLPKERVVEGAAAGVGPTVGRLLANKKYLEGVVAQAFYVGAQIMCWTFIIQYAENELGMRQDVAQAYNIGAMVIFCCSRFICTFLLKFINPGSLLALLAVGGLGLTLGAILIHGMPGLYCLVGVSACMSLMFPTIYGIALDGLGDDAKLGAAGLIMAIGGGCLMPPLQASIMDITNEAGEHIVMGLSSYRASFVLPAICFVVIAVYGFRTHLVHGHRR